jgi:2-(1,2-epoxy-1,2-dihydrophenyl)acetyl-CoA isomerase
VVGIGRASELILSGRTVPAAEAERIGLVDRVVPEDSFHGEVRAYAGALAAKPPLALTAAKRTLARSLVSDLEEGLLAESGAQMTCFRSADAREGIAAFVEKRTPEFTGE